MTEPTIAPRVYSNACFLAAGVVIFFGFYVFFFKIKFAPPPKKYPNFKLTISFTKPKRIMSYSINGVLKHLLCFSFSLILIGCSPTDRAVNSPATGENDTFNLVDENNNFSLRLPWVNKKLLLTPEHQREISAYLQKIFKKKGFEHLDNTEVLVAFELDNDVIINPVVTLVGMGYKEGQQFPVAREFYVQRLEKNNGGIGGGPMGGGEVHSCTGKPCSCCSFVKEQYWSGPFLSSRITGCKCDQSPASTTCAGEEGSCNHTLSSAP